MVDSLQQQYHFFSGSKRNLEKINIKKRIGIEMEKREREIEKGIPSTNIFLWSKEMCSFPKNTVKKNLQKDAKILVAVCHS